PVEQLCALSTPAPVHGWLRLHARDTRGCCVELDPRLHAVCVPCPGCTSRGSWPCVRLVLASRPRVGRSSRVFQGPGEGVFSRLACGQLAVSLWDVPPFSLPSVRSRFLMMNTARLVILAFAAPW